MDPQQRILLETALRRSATPGSPWTACSGEAHQPAQLHALVTGTEATTG